MSPTGQPAGPSARLHPGPVLRTLDRAFAGLVAWAGRGPVRSILIVTLVALAAVLPGIAEMPVTDRDEARFVQATKQMLETGDLIDIRFQDEPRWKKPVGIYWLQAASASLAGGTEAPIWAYRIPSALAVILGALATLWAARPLVGPGAAVLAGIIVPSLLLAAAEATIAKTDAALMLSAIVAMGAMGRALTGTAGRWTWLAFWLAIAAGILLKGPVVPTVALLAAGGVAFITLTLPRLGELRPLWGIGLTVLLVGPWLIAIWVISDGAFFRESVGEDMLAKVAAGQESHGAPPGLYLAIVWLSFWPWAAFLPAAARRLWAWRRALPAAFLIAWVVPFWLVLEAVPTKLPHYVLPLYPALAIAVAGMLAGPWRQLPHREDRRAKAETPKPSVRTAPAKDEATGERDADDLTGGEAAGELASGARSASTRGSGTHEKATAARPDWTPPGKWAGWVLALLMGLPPVALATAVIILPVVIEGPVVLEAVGLGVAGGVLGVMAARAARRGAPMAQGLLGLASALCLYPAVLQHALPAMKTAFPSPRMAALAERFEPCASGPLVSIGYREPSLVFLAGTGISLGPVETAAERLAADPGTMVLVEDRWRERLDVARGADAAPLVERGAVSYFNYNRGKWETARLLTRDDPRWQSCTAETGTAEGTPSESGDGTTSASPPPAVATDPVTEGATGDGASSGEEAGTDGAAAAPETGGTPAGDDAGGNAGESDAAPTPSGSGASGGDGSTAPSGAEDTAPATGAGEGGTAGAPGNGDSSGEPAAASPDAGIAAPQD